jgi:hypothetical protein
VVSATTSAPFTGKLVLVGEANVAEVEEGSIMYMICGIAQSEDGGQPRNIRLNICRARKPR